MPVYMIYFMKFKFLFENTFLSNPINKIAGFVGFVFATLYALAQAYMADAPPFLYYALITLGVGVVADTIAGVALALRDGKFSLNVLRASLVKVIMYASSILVLIPLGCMISAMGVTPDQYLLVGILSAYLATIELLSFIRLTKRLGMKWPKPIENIIEKISGDLDSDLVCEEGDVPLMQDLKNSLEDSIEEVIDPNIDQSDARRDE